jgi:hypothetical protein
VSLAFATRLGYITSDFKPLNHKERAGGVSASGHPITFEGALRLSWYHSTSPQYDNMRFVIIDNAPFDLVIGGQSIVKHKLICPLNLTQQCGGINVVHPGGTFGHYLCRRHRTDTHQTEQGKVYASVLALSKMKFTQSRDALRARAVPNNLTGYMGRWTNYSANFKIMTPQEAQRIFRAKGGPLLFGSF